MRGAAGPDAQAAEAVSAFMLDGLHPREVEALEAEDDEYVSGLICSAVVLARAIRHQAKVDDALASDRNVVVLPAPLAPRMVVIPPCSKEKLMPCKA